MKLLGPCYQLLVAGRCWAVCSAAALLRFPALWQLHLGLEWRCQSHLRNAPPQLPAAPCSVDHVSFETLGSLGCVNQPTPACKVSCKPPRKDDVPASHPRRCDVSLVIKGWGGVRQNNAVMTPCCPKTCQLSSLSQKCIDKAASDACRFHLGSGLCRGCSGCVPRCCAALRLPCGCACSCCCQWAGISAQGAGWRPSLSRGATCWWRPQLSRVCLWQAGQRQPAHTVAA